MMKKCLMILMAGLMLCVLTMTTAYAEEGTLTMEQGMPGGQRGGGRMMDGDMGIPPEKPEGVEGEMPERPEGMGETPPELPEGMTEEDMAAGTPGGGRGGRGGQAPDGEMPLMLDIDSTKEAIAAVEDETTQESLSALLTAYETALESERTAMDSQSTDETTRQTAMEAVQTAREALEEALTALGIDVTTLTQLMEGFDILNING